MQYIILKILFKLIFVFHQNTIFKEISLGGSAFELEGFVEVTGVRIFMIILIMEIHHNQKICISYALNLIPMPLSAGEGSVICCGHRPVAYRLSIGQAKLYANVYVRTDTKIKKSSTHKGHMLHLGTLSIYSI